MELYQKPAPREVLHDETEEDDDGLEEAIASFSDGSNTGFNINSYTTKHCPTMDGVLEELRKGIARLEEQREADAVRLKEMEDKVSKGLICEAPAPKKKSAFAETLNTLSRLQSSYRRCYWKSGSEMLFPILFGHLTYASHRCWTVYNKKAIFLAAEAWRIEYGQSVSHAAKKAAGGEILLFQRRGVDAYPLVGWRRIHVGELELFEGPEGQRCITLAEAFDVVMSSKVSSEDQKDARIAVSVLHRFLTEEMATTTSRHETQHPDGHDSDGEEEPQIPTSRVSVTTSTIEDWLWRGNNALVKT